MLNRNARTRGVHSQDEGRNGRGSAPVHGTTAALSYTNQAVCEEGERFEEIVDATLRAIKGRAGVEDDPSIAAFLSIVELPEVTERVTDLTAPPGLLELVADSGDTKKAVERIREVEYGIICDMCRSDLDLVRIIVDAGQACDGVLASFAGQMARAWPTSCR
ncbi:hypothetical protein OFY05_23080 (plasmid) [Pseudocitrobacter faecalis]|nr:hypothetical protein OFY05_23080 [Pseudocitrobacter faecalis]